MMTKNAKNVLKLENPAQSVPELRSVCLPL